MIYCVSARRQQIISELDRQISASRFVLMKRFVYVCLGGFDVGEEGRWVRRGGGWGGLGAPQSAEEEVGEEGGEEGGDKTKRHGGSETLHKHLAAWIFLKYLALDEPNLLTETLWDALCRCDRCLCIRMKIIRLHAALIFNKRQTGAEGTLIHAEIQEIQQTMRLQHTSHTHHTLYITRSWIHYEPALHVCDVCLQMFNCPFIPLLGLILDFKADLQKSRASGGDAGLDCKVERSCCDAALRFDWSDEADERTSHRCAGWLAAGGRRRQKDKQEVIRLPGLECVSSWYTWCVSQVDAEAFSCPLVFCRRPFRINVFTETTELL